VLRLYSPFSGFASTLAVEKEIAMSESRSTSESFQVEDFLSVVNRDRADKTVSEIFRMMLGFEANAVDAAAPDLPSSGLDEKTAIVGFSGSMRGSCHIRINSLAAVTLASAMLGGTPVDDNDSIDDALGELCNMLAGGWKNCVPSLSSACALSPPTVISGSDYKVHTNKPSEKLSRTYQFDIHRFQLTLSREDTNFPRE
jgi:chemotaxis protein CheX